MAYLGKGPQASASRDNRSELLGHSSHNSVLGHSSNNSVLLGHSSGVNNPAYAASPSTAAPPLTELDQMHLQINKTTDESLDSTRRMVGLLEESQTVGAKTMENLYRQGEQLDKVEDNLDTVNQDMREAERNMEQMEKCCGLCVCPWRRRRNFEKFSGYQKAYGDKGATGGARPERDAIRMEQPNMDGAAMNAGGHQQFITRITNDAREDEMDENLNAVGGMLGGLKMMATDMGREIDTQNQALDRLNTKAAIADERVLRGNKRAEDILRKA